MPPENLFLNRAVVLAFALIYWAGVWVQARRVRRRIGRSPNVRPRGLKEQVLWLGWMLVVFAWLLLPFLSGGGRGNLLALAPVLLGLSGLAVGIFMMIAGYAVTIWCYRAMGNAWRMGVNKDEKIQIVTGGPYRFVRHPIYLSQLLMVAAIAVLLPCVLSLVILIVHFICIFIKAADEDAFLLTVQSREYQEYRARTGGLFPRFGAAPTPAADSTVAKKESSRPAGRDPK